ncbi:MAG TPA: prolipoprotein diacylglyceryl transferase [Sandaracinaceae bacterium LLY-WYZ-13_1]|nr:prolipoprotein diacylglyceryl transferase [Sandaracinaceae bacterium LLY-WYZ-13_1]
MIPRFGEIFGEPIPAYFAMLMTGFLVAVGVGVVWARRSELDHDVIIDLGLVSLIAGVAGARILHVFVDGYFWDYVHLCTDPAQVSWQIPRAQCASLEGIWDAQAGVCHPAEGDCFAWAKFWQGGLVWYGGLLGAGAYGIYFLHKERFPVLKGIDMAGMVLPLGVFFGRLGCWFGGCCFGVHSDHWSAVRFPAWSPASESQFRAGLLDHPGVESLPVLPTQLYEAAGCLAITAFLMFVLHPRKRFDGQVFVVSMALYAILRFFLEFLRADDRGGVLGVSTSQWIGLGMVVGMGVLWRVFAQRAKARAAEPLDDVPPEPYWPPAEAKAG